MGNVHTSGPNEALIVSGGCANAQERKLVIVGSWVWAWWFVTDVQRLSLEVMTLEPHCDDVETKQGKLAENVKIFNQKVVFLGTTIGIFIESIIRLFFSGILK